MQESQWNLHENTTNKRLNDFNEETLAATPLVGLG